MQEVKRESPRDPLTLERVLDAAIAIADTEGFDALSLRALARKLSVTPMALYRYVDNGDQLADLVVGRIVDDAVAEVDWSVQPDEALGQLADVVLGLIRVHPTMLERYERQGVTTPTAVAVIDRLLGILCASGLTGDDAIRAYTTVHYYTLGFAAMSRNEHPTAPTEGLDPADYPVLSANAATWRGTREDSHFHAGLALIINAVLQA